MNYELLISDGERAFTPDVTDGIVWSTTRRGSAGKLTFSVMRNREFEPSEGNMVTLSMDGKNVFRGYIFSMNRDKEGIVAVTAYDQLRYFKNRDTYVYSGKSAAQILKMLADDMGMETGEITDTRYVIPSRVEDNETLFDIVENALDLTLQNTGEMFVMYDDCGKLSLKSVSEMVVRDGDKYPVFDEDCAENFELSSSIEDAFNQIKLVRENKKSGKREVFTAKSDENIKAWGVLQYFGKLGKDENGKAKAEALLKLYNAKSRGLELKNAIGDVRVRAGTMVGISLKESGIDGVEFMLVENARHVFKENEHLMDLTLRGGDVNG